MKKGKGKVAIVDIRDMGSGPGSDSGAESEEYGDIIIPVFQQHRRLTTTRFSFQEYTYKEEAQPCL